MVAIDNTGSGTLPVRDDIWDNVNEFGDDWCNEDLTNNPDCVVTNINQPSQDCLDAECEYVCDGNECLDTCRNCISDID